MDWYYHDPGRGRVGPLPADDLRRRYRERRIQLDTLVWREGLREWQPLARLVDELDLTGVEPDPSLPPPLPPVIAPGAAGMLARPVASAGPRRPPPRRMNGCLIALIVAAALAVPLLGILAAIALPAYNDYTVRAKLAATIDEPARRLQPALLAARERLGRCPRTAGELGLDPGSLPPLQAGELEDGRCAFELTVSGVDSRVDGATVLYAVPGPGPGGWDCSGGDLPDRYRPRACRAPSMDETP